MTRERIEDFREIVLPFLRNVLLKTNYENLGKSDAEEFARDFNEILDMAIEALEQYPILDKLDAEIERQEKWLMDAGYNQYNVDIALDAIKSVVDNYKAESEKTDG